ncbi:NTP transferase domain-containing protein [Candidatus Calescamantes bacterium]|nr:NTP transferase domain-containing protein [Candidatus Calescamantes bacterium]
MRKDKVIGVVLAGGKSSRYHRLKHKYLDIYKGEEIIKHVLKAMKPLVEEIVVVVGPHHEEVREVLQDFNPPLKFAIQESPLGTGHALLSTAPLLENKDAILLVSFADKPLITSSTLSLLLTEHLRSKAEITLTTAILPEPGSKGRIIRKDGKFVDIVEAKDADEEIKKVKEVHAGYLCCYTRSIYERLRRLDNKNAAGEYYLTKVYQEFIIDGLSVHTVEIPGRESYDINAVHHLDNIQEWESLFTSEKKEN